MLLLSDRVWNISLEANCQSKFWDTTITSYFISQCDSGTSCFCDWISGNSCLFYQVYEHKYFCLPCIPLARVRWLNYNWVMYVLSFSRVFLQDLTRIKSDAPLETEWYRWCSFIAVSKYQMPNCSSDKARHVKVYKCTMLSQHKRKEGIGQNRNKSRNAGK